MKDFTCIICPRGCHLYIDDNENVTGNSCPRGKIYALNEIHDPKRTVTSICKVENRDGVYVSCKTVPEVKKPLIMAVMKEINKARIKAPVKRGDVIIKNVLNSGSDVVATKDID